MKDGGQLNLCSRKSEFQGNSIFLDHFSHITKPYLNRWWLCFFELWFVSAAWSDLVVYRERLSERQEPRSPSGDFEPNWLERLECWCSRLD